MPGRDIRSKLVPILLFNAAITTDTNTDSSQLDTADYDGGVKINAFSSAWTDGTYTLQIHTSDTTGFTPGASTLLSTSNLIPASGSIVLTAALAAASTIDSLGFISAKRYMKVRIVSTLTSSGATIIITSENNPEIKPGV